MHEEMDIPSPICSNPNTTKKAGNTEIITTVYDLQKEMQKLSIKPVTQWYPHKARTLASLDQTCNSLH